MYFDGDDEERDYPASLEEQEEYNVNSQWEPVKEDDDDDDQEDEEENEEEIEEDRSIDFEPDNDDDELYSDNNDYSDEDELDL